VNAFCFASSRSARRASGNAGMCRSGEGWAVGLTQDGRAGFRGRHPPITAPGGGDERGAVGHGSAVSSLLFTVTLANYVTGLSRTMRGAGLSVRRGCSSADGPSRGLAGFGSLSDGRDTVEA
jgi:hypothetical protein